MAPIGVIVRLLPNGGVGDGTLIIGCSLNADCTESVMIVLVVTLSTIFVNDIGAIDGNGLVVESFDDAAIIVVDFDGAGNIVELFDDRICFASFATVVVADAAVALAAGSVLLFVVIIGAVFWLTVLTADILSFANIFIDGSSGFLFSFGFLSAFLLKIQGNGKRVSKNYRNIVFFFKIILSLFLDN